MNFITFLQNNQGENSSVRLILFLYSIGVLFVWIVASLKSIPIQLSVFPDSVLYCLGLIVGAKGYEKFIENKKEKCEPKE